MNSRFLSRVRFITLFFIAVAIAILGRLYVLQVMHGEAYRERADAQFVEPSSPLVDRNSIFFTDKDGNEIVAATLKNGYALAVNPQKVTDPAATYAAIKGIIPQTEAEFDAKVSNKDSQYALLAQHLDDANGQELLDKNIPGLIVENDRWRFYPGGSLAAQALGFVAYNGDAQEGRYGLERYYEQTLEKQDDSLYSNFFVELFGGVQHILSGAPQSGDLVTTIEPSVQAELERQLSQYMKTWTPQLAGGIIMNPQNGEIYAMAVSPTFDLNQFSSQKDPLIFADPLVENVYEMGSIIKPLTMAAGIDSGAVTPDSTYDDTGCISLDGKKICNYDFVARGVIPMQQILSQSLNVGASYIATKMGQPTMLQYFLDKYKLNQETGIDLPGEVHGLTDNLTQAGASQVEFDTASFGQGIAITPIETIRALSTLANGGYLVTPHLVKAVHYDTGVTQQKTWGKSEQVLKTQTVTDVTRMLTKVVDTAFAKGMSFPDYSVAAKTGTGQIVNPATGQYYTDRYLHSYFGYFPSYDPKFIILLFAVKPVGALYSSETWGTYFHSLTEFLINYYNVPPDR